MKTNVLVLAISTVLATQTSLGQNITNEVFGSPATDYRADDVPAGEVGRFYLPGAGASNDNLNPSSYSQRLRLKANLRANANLSCDSMDFYSNVEQEVSRMRYKLTKLIKKGKQAALTSASAAISSFFQYSLMKINPTLGQLTTKELDETLELFDARIKECKDYERDVKNGKNPLSEIVQISVGDQWKRTIGLVNKGKISLEEAKEEALEEAKKNGVTMADGEAYGGEGQKPINITQSLLKSGMNLILARPDKSKWSDDFDQSSGSLKNNPILREFKNPDALYQFIADIYGSIETTIATNSKTGEEVASVAGRGYELKYVEYRNEYFPHIKQYVERDIKRKEFEKKTHIIIPPVEINDIRQMGAYERSVEMERLAKKFAINRLNNNLKFAKQALKSGVYAPDLQQSGMKGPSMAEYKSIYYRILDDLAELNQKAAEVQY